MVEEFTVHTQDSLFEEGEHFRRSDEQDVEHGDADEREREGPLTGRADRRVSATDQEAVLLGETEFADEEVTADAEQGQRKAEGEDEVEPEVGALQFRIVLLVEVAEPTEVESLVVASDATDVVPAEPGNVEEDAESVDGDDAPLRYRPADQLPRPERVADGQVPTDGHRDRQPRAGHHERVDQRLSVGGVEEGEVDADPERIPLDEAVRDDGQAEERVGHGQGCQPDAGEPLDAAHRRVRGLEYEDYEAGHVADEAERADPDHDPLVEGVLDGIVKRAARGQVEDGTVRRFVCVVTCRRGIMGFAVEHICGIGGFQRLARGWWKMPCCRSSTRCPDSWAGRIRDSNETPTFVLEIKKKMISPWNVNSSETLGIWRSCGFVRDATS